MTVASQVAVTSARGKKFGYVLATAPILIYWIYWTLNPSYWFNADPAAFYFIDSLSVFVGKSYLYVDHPGTPMQIIGTILLAQTYPFLGGGEDFINFYITKPEAFFLMANVFLLAANLFTANIFYHTASKTLGHDRVLGAGALTVLFFALHPNSFPSLTFWSHNSLNYPFGTLLLLWLYREMRGEIVIGRSKLFLLGFAAGVLAIVQIYFFVWVASGIFTVSIFTYRLNKNFRQALSSALYMSLGSVMGILAMLVPIYRELPRFINWVSDVATHTGLYGTGGIGIYSFDTLQQSISFWWSSIRPMMALLTITLIGLAAFAFLKNRSSPKVSASDFAMTIGLLLHIGLLIVLLSKAGFKLRYTLSLAAVLPVLVLLALKLSEGTFLEKSKWTRVLYASIFAGVLIALAQQIELAGTRARVEEAARFARSQAITRLARELGLPKEEVVVVYAYAVPLQCSGMLEASTWTGHFKEEISAMCPNQYAIFDTDVKLNSAARLFDIKDIDWDLVIWPGNGSDLPEYLKSIGAINIPQDWHVRRSAWFFIRQNYE